MALYFSLRAQDAGERHSVGGHKSNPYVESLARPAGVVIALIWIF